MRFKDRVKKLEKKAKIRDLPPIFYLDGTEGPNSIWIDGITREQAEQINSENRWLYENYERKIIGEKEILDDEK